MRFPGSLVSGCADAGIGGQDPMARAVAKAPGGAPAVPRAWQEDMGSLKRSPWGQEWLRLPDRPSHPMVSPPPGGPCGHHSSGQPSAVYVCQGDRWLWNAQGQGTCSSLCYPEPGLCAPSVSHPHCPPGVLVSPSPSMYTGAGGSRPGCGGPFHGTLCVGRFFFPLPQAQALVQYLEEPLTQVAAS